MRLFDYSLAADPRLDLVNGHYELEAVKDLLIDGRIIAYRMGSASLDNSCCGSYGCAYALVLGERVDAAGTASATTLRLRELAQDDPLIAAIRHELAEREHISVINFFTLPPAAETRS